LVGRVEGVDDIDIGDMGILDVDEHGVFILAIPLLYFCVL
jgi:hypothetical protein